MRSLRILHVVANRWWTGSADPALDVARRLQQRYLTEPGTVAWVCSGSEPARGFIFRWLEQRRRANASQ